MEAEQVGLELRVEAGPGVVHRLGHLDPVRVLVVERHHPDPLEPFGAFVDGEMAGEGVDAVEFHVGAVGDHLATTRPLEQREVLGAVGVGRHEEAVAVVVDGVLHALASRQQHLRCRRRLGGVDHVALAGDLALQRDHDVSTTPRPVDPHEEVLVVFLQDQLVVSDAGADDVPPHLVGPHGVVGPGVEEGLVVAPPRGAVIGVGDDVDEVGARGQRPHLHLVLLRTVRIGGVQEEGVVGAHVEGADGEVLVAGGEHVLVEKHLLGFGVRSASPAAVDRVLEALHRPRVVPVVAAPHRDRQVGLLDSSHDFVEQRFPQGLGRCHDGAGVGVLGLEIGDDVGIVAVPQPVPVVDAPVSVFLQHGGPARRHRGLGNQRHGRQPTGTSLRLHSDSNDSIMHACPRSPSVTCPRTSAMNWPPAPRAPVAPCRSTCEPS